MGDPIPLAGRDTFRLRPASRFGSNRRSMPTAHRPWLAGHEPLIRTAPTPHLTYSVTF